MSLIDDFKDEMAQIVTIYPYQSNNGWGDQYGDGVSYPCAVCHRKIEVKRKGGDSFVSSLQIHLDKSVAVSARDKVEFDGEILVVLDVSTEYDIEEPSEIYARVIYA